MIQDKGKKLGRSLSKNYKIGNEETLRDSLNFVTRTVSTAVRSIFAGGGTWSFKIADSYQTLWKFKVCTRILNKTDEISCYKDSTCVK